MDLHKDLPADSQPTALLVVGYSVSQGKAAGC